MIKTMIKTQTLKGFRDFLPAEVKKRQYVINTLKKVFESYGFEPLETPALEYEEKERGNDWFWAIGIITVVACGIAVWLHNYVFAVFLLISGCCLIMFTLRHPQDITYTVETKGLSMGKDLYEWKTSPQYPYKIGFREGEILYECDRWGEKIKV